MPAYVIKATSRVAIVKGDEFLVPARSAAQARDIFYSQFFEGKLADGDQIIDLAEAGLVVREKSAPTTGDAPMPEPDEAPMDAA